jgi:hypothetical protein
MNDIGFNIKTWITYEAPKPIGSTNPANTDYNPVIEIMENFDFVKVQRVMEFLDWKWYMGCDERGNEINQVPSLQYLKDYCYKRLCFAREYGYGLDSGGFSYGNDNGVLYLEFTLEAEASCDFSTITEGLEL